MNRKKIVNPFYVLLLLAGCTFAVTATAYGVMTVRQLHASRARWSADPAQRETSFHRIVDRYGAKAMLVELVVLGVGTAGAILFDQRLDARASREPDQPNG